MAITKSSPSARDSPQECFDLTIKAFNFAEEFRVPVMFMDGRSRRPHDREVVIPPADQIEVFPRKHHSQNLWRITCPTGTNGGQVPEMAHAGEGYNFHVTGLTHDERGYPNMTPPVQDKLVRRLQHKIRAAPTASPLFEESSSRAPT